MKKQKNYVFKCHRAPAISLFIHAIILVISIIMLVLFSQSGFKVMFGISIVIFIVAQPITFISSLFFGWNAVIYFDKEKIWLKRRSKKYEWRWTEMNNCRFRIYKWRVSYVIIEITTESDYKKLTLEASHKRCKFFKECCPNEKINEQFKNAIGEMSLWND